ncbi:class F sortase [Dactylosporangium sp. NPDC049525]|uniref:class F sortase n=1 Tax=Dactylosporangium sp. NPDC049525 TaxID=3154730 RepID=UPI00344419B2
MTGTLRGHGSGAFPVPVAVVLLFALAACSGDPPPSVGGAAASALASPSAPVTSGVPVQAGALPAAAATITPTRLQVGRLRLTARVDPVGIDAATGDFAVPPSIDEVGWYRFGPGLEATAGSIVIAGHVDSAEQGKGAFFRLRELTPGDAMTVTGSDGSSRVFTVVAREIFAKTAVPLERYFARDGAVRLTLITCGGPFDARTRHYRDNVVITAQPVER